MALLQHLLLSLRLNFRSTLPVIYGYLVPVFFLIGFAAVFSDVRAEFGPLLTISVLGGTCFGMPTAMVAERQRGIWRRYRLLPAATASFIASTLIARLVLVASAAVLQIVLAIGVYHMAAPAHPVQLAVAFIFVSWAFGGLGLVIAMLADTVPAVQALGQAVFLPMILIGGVGIPLSVLPRWARIVAGYLPGRYAVAALGQCISGSGLGEARFSLLALALIGAAAVLAGANMFRWEADQKIAPARRGWIALALAAWAAIGITAQLNGQSALAAAVAPSNYQSITQAQIDSITYQDLPDDNGLITPLVMSVDDLSESIQQWVKGFRLTLAAWPPGHDTDWVQRTRNLLAVAAIADLSEYPYEGEVPMVVFEQLKSQFPANDLERILTLIILDPNGGGVPASAADMGIAGRPSEADVRQRSAVYAKKLLGRLLGKLP